MPQCFGTLALDLRVQARSFYTDEVFGISRALNLEFCLLTLERGPASVT